ncbi:hypothetical protein K6025_01455 [Ehrlichia sp. JZT12]
MKILQQISATVAQESSAYTQMVSSNISKAHGINFLEKDGKIFSVYYVENDVVGDNIVCEVQDNGSIYSTIVNDYPISKHIVKSYLSEMLFVKTQDNDFLIIVFPEKVGKYEKRNLLLKVYKIHYSPSISLVNTNKICLTGTSGVTREEVKYPVVLNQDKLGRIVVIARTDYDSRGVIADRLYVMWKLAYKDGEFKIIKPGKNGYRQFNNEYLFKYSGYIGYEQYRDRMIMISKIDDRLSFFYVGQYISNYKFFSSIYEVSTRYNLNFGRRKCIINPSYGCNLIDDYKYRIPVSGIDVINVVRNKENTYVAYVGIVRNSRYEKQLVVVHSTKGKQLSVYDFMPIDYFIDALYVNYVGDSLVIVTMGTSNIVRYEMSELQLRYGNIEYIDVIRVQRQQIKNIEDFVYILTGNITISNIAYTNITNVRARSYGDRVPSFSISIREVQSKDIFKNENNYASSVTTDPLQSVTPSYTVGSISKYPTVAGNLFVDAVKSGNHNVFYSPITSEMLLTSQPLQSPTPNYSVVEGVTEFETSIEDYATRSTANPSIFKHSSVHSSTHSMIQSSSIDEDNRKVVMPTIVTKSSIAVSLSTSKFDGFVRMGKGPSFSNSVKSKMLVTSDPLQLFIPNYPAVKSVTKIRYAGDFVTKSTVNQDISKYSEKNASSSTHPMIQVLSINRNSSSEIIKYPMVTESVGDLPNQSDSFVENKDSSTLYNPVTRNEIITYVDTTTESILTTRGDYMSGGYGTPKLGVKTYSKSTTKLSNEGNIKKYINNDSDIEYGLSSKRVRYNVKRTTIRSSPRRNRMTMKRHVLYNDGLVVNDYMNSTMLNFTKRNISGLYHLLVNDSANVSTSLIAGNSTVDTVYSRSPAGLWVGVALMLICVCVFFKSVFNTVANCNDVKKHIGDCLPRRRRLTVPVNPINVFALQDVGENIGNRRSGSSYGSV